jgi:hypothetical protein
MENEQKLPEGEAPKQSESEFGFEDLYITMANVAELDERLEEVEGVIKNLKITVIVMKEEMEEDSPTTEEKPCGCHKVQDDLNNVFIETIYEDVMERKQKRAEITDAISNFIVNVAFGVVCVCLGVELAKKFPKWFK